jgi:uncharacterized protein (DUF58 family)
MISSLNQLEEERKVVYKVYSKNIRISILFYVLAVVGITVSMILGYNYVIFGIFLSVALFIVGIIFGAKAIKATKPFRKSSRQPSSKHS